MAYQNVGSPRFYVNVYEWANEMEMNITNFNPFLYTLPVNPEPFSTTDVLTNLHNHVPEVTSTNLYPCFVAILGHAFTGNFSVYDAGSTQGIINRHPASGYKGFSILKTETLATRVTAGAGDAGSVIIGVCYDMTAPNLSLTMSRDYGGTKEFTTYNGSSMSNTMWIKAPKWGDLGAWELGDSNPALSRSGRRSWDLKFSYMDDGNLWGSNQSLSTILNTPTGLEGSDFSESAWGTSIISSNDMENYYSNEYDDFTATPTGFTGTSDGFSSIATTATPGSGTQGDLNITAGLQYKVSFHLAIEAKNAWQDPTAPSFGIYNHQGDASPITNELTQDSIAGFNEYFFTANETDTSALIKFTTGNNVDDTITAVSDLKCQPAGSSSDFTYNLLTDDNFFSHVWHKTLGGTLPFIFQPDSSNNNPDQFAICKFKDNSLKATQSAFNVYDISLSIEEVW